MDAREDNRKRNHKQAMQVAHDISFTMKQQLVALDKEGAKLRWEIRKHKTQVAKDKEAVDILKWGVAHAEKKVTKKAEAVTRREDIVIGQTSELVKERDNIELQKQVTHPCFL
jgi:hypothetical protein